MFSTLSRRCFSLLSILLLVFIDLMPSSAAAFTTTQISVEVKGDCLGCSLAQQFPSLHQQLEGEVPWTVTTRHFGKRTLTGLVAIASSTTSIHPPVGLKPLEQQAWLAMAARGQIHLFSPQRYKGSSVVFQGAAQAQVQLPGAQSAKTEQHDKTLHPALLDSAGRRNESAVPWHDLEGDKRLRLVVEPGGVSYPLVVDPTWSTTSSMSTLRDSHTATLLLDGKVLVTGGYGGINNGYLSSAELYDPQTGTWSTTGSMSTPRANHTATLLKDGKVLVTGGYLTSGVDNISSILSSAELYDPQSGTWSATDSMRTEKYNHTATLLKNGKVLVVGDYFNIGILRSSVELYDPQSGTWSDSEPTKTPRSSHTATLLPNGKVLVTGGNDDTGFTSNSVELYDPRSGKWSTTDSMSTPRAVHTATLLKNGKVLVAGGSNNISPIVSSAELYNPRTGNWSTTDSMSTPRAVHTATLLKNGKVLVVGGFNTSEEITISLSSAELYDPQSDTWSTTDSMSMPRFIHTAMMLKNGEVLVTGGVSNLSETLSSAELYKSR